MADANELDHRDESGKDRIDGLMTHVARGRVAVGLAALAAPRLSMRLIGLGGAADPGRDFAVRAFGAREVALGAGYLLSGDLTGRRLWARLGLAVDALDAVSAAKTRPGPPLWAKAGVLAVSGTAAGIGAAKVTRDLLG